MYTEDKEFFEYGITLIHKLIEKISSQNKLMNSSGCVEAIKEVNSTYLTTDDVLTISKNKLSVCFNDFAETIKNQAVKTSEINIITNDI